ncbi:MAG: hypothetical protein ABI625_21825, partial [bacterium]
HDVLNALGLESPVRGFELAADSSVIMDLAVESGATVRMKRCGKDAGGPFDGMLAGVVLDAAHEAPAAGADVKIRWVENTLQQNGFRSVPKQVVFTTGDDGQYLACGVPSDAAIDVVVVRKGFRSVTGQLLIPSGGALRQDFLLADSGATHGTAAITGRAVHQDSSALRTGVISVDALALDTPIRDGAFSLGGIPAGTWFIELKAIGYQPRTMLANATNGSFAPLRIVLEKEAQTLEAVNVIGTASRDTRVLNAILERSHSATGTLFLPGNSWLETATSPADVLRAAPGFRQKDQYNVQGRGDCKTVAVYLDGNRMADLFSLTFTVPMKSILAIEAYPDISLAPIQFRNQAYEPACAVVAVWTKR